MEWFHKSTVLIVGLGLIGGSYAKALKRMDYHVTAIDTNIDSINYAIENGIIDEGAVAADSSLIEKADTIILALYPGLIKEWIISNQDRFRSSIRITDVTGVKECIVYDIQRILREDVEFIAAHPMAGREVCGVRNSDEKIFREANYLVVPTAQNTDEAIEWCKNLGKILGFKKITVLSPKEHDRMIAYVSQLTHCIAIALMTSNGDGNLVSCTGDSFRDITRIAKINEDMWCDLFLRNRQELVSAMSTFIDELSGIKEMIEQEDEEGLKEKMRLSTHRRALFEIS